MAASLPKPIPYHLMDAIRHGIIVGRYPAGSSLREQKLETEYGASRGPIREALRLLEIRGLVTHEPRRGFRVRRLDAVTVRQIYALRALLEGHVVSGLIAPVPESLLTTLRATNEAMRAHRASGDTERYLQGNIEFHATILEHAPNPVLRKSLDLVNEVAEPLRFALLSRDILASRAVEQHEDIVKLLAQGRIDDAAAAMRDHVLAGLPAALSTIENAAEGATA
jgi:DNA-binding GntR family transcriptional regulator